MKEEAVYRQRREFKQMIQYTKGIKDEMVKGSKAVKISSSKAVKICGSMAVKTEVKESKGPPSEQRSKMSGRNLRIG